MRFSHIHPPCSRLDLLGTGLCLPYLLKVFHSVVSNQWGQFVLLWPSPPSLATPPTLDGPISVLRVPSKGSSLLRGSIQDCYSRVSIQSPAPTPLPLRSFYFSRFLRLYPVFITVTLLTGVWSWWLAENLPGTWSPLSSIQVVTSNFSPAATFLTYLPNITLIGADLPPLFNLIDDHLVEIAGASRHAPPTWCLEARWMGYTLFIPPAWSLGLIFSFYLVTPLLMRTPSVNRCLLWGLISISAWLAFGPLFFFGGYFVGALWYWLFCIGILSFFAYRRMYQALDALASRSSVRAFMFSLPLVVLMFVYTFGFQGGPIVLGVLVGLVLPLAAASSRSSALDQYMGRLSYPLFCFHMLALSMSTVLIQELGLSWNLLLPITLFGSSVFAILAVRYLEVPLKKIRHRSFG